MRIVGIVTARGGSKGIPRKNLALLAGRPLLEYTAASALAARRLDRVILSTEDEEIAAVGRRCGLEVPLLRPAELATDDTPTVLVVQHALAVLESQGARYDAVCLLQPTSPLRLPEDIDGSIELMERTGADSVISLVEVGAKHPGRMKLVGADLEVTEPAFARRFQASRRQDLAKLYRTEGTIYLARTEVLVQQHTFRGKHCRAWLMPPARACDVDTSLDLYIAEQLLRLQSGTITAVPA